MSSGDGRLDTVIRLTCGRALSLAPLPSEVDLIDGKSDGESVVAAFAEQFAVDVSRIGQHQRKQFLSALGDNAFRVAAAIFIADFVPRVWAGFEALGLGKAGHGPVVDWDHDTDPADALLNGFVPAVARMRQLDAVTTEVVRLRGATQHNCRLCKSLRDSSALQAGGSESLYSGIEDYETSTELSDRHKAALRLADAMILGTPVDREDARAHFSEREIAELLLDVVKWSVQKPLVALRIEPAPNDGELTRMRADESGAYRFGAILQA